MTNLNTTTTPTPTPTPTSTPTPNTKNHCTNDNDYLLFERQFEEVIQTTPNELREAVKSYFNSINDMEKKTLLIAKKHLGTSFNLLKSNGFVNFEKQL